MTEKSETVGVGRSGWVPALKAQIRLMAELESRFKSGNSVPVERTYITAAEFAVIETYMQEDEALSTDLGMANFRLSEAHEQLLSGLEALAGDMVSAASLRGVPSDRREQITRWANELRTLASAGLEGK